MNGRRTSGYMTVKDPESKQDVEAPAALQRLDSVSTKMSLAYNNLLMNADGSILSTEHIKELRERYGYCVTCQGEPVKLYDIRKSKLNPLWKSKEPLTAMHMSLNGVCLKCHPALDPHAMMRRNSQYRFSQRNLKVEGSFRSLPTTASATSMSSTENSGSGRGLRPLKSEPRLAVPRQNSLRVQELEESTPSAPQRSSLSTIHSNHNQEQNMNSSGHSVDSSRQDLPEIPVTPSPLINTRHLAMNLTPEGDVVDQLPPIPLSAEKETNERLTDKPPSPTPQEGAHRPGFIEQFSNPDFSQSDPFKSHRKKKKKSKSKSKSKKSASIPESVSESHLQVPDTINERTMQHSLPSLDAEAWFEDFRNFHNQVPAAAAAAAAARQKKSPYAQGSVRSGSDDRPEHSKRSKSSRRREKADAAAARRPSEAGSGASDLDIWGEPTLSSFVADTKPSPAARPPDDASWPEPPSLVADGAKRPPDEHWELKSPMSMSSTQARKHGRAGRGSGGHTPREHHTPREQHTPRDSSMRGGFGPPARHPSVDSISFQRDTSFSTPKHSEGGSVGKGRRSSATTPRSFAPPSRSMSPRRDHHGEFQGFTPPARAGSAERRRPVPLRSNSDERRRRTPRREGKKDPFGPPTRNPSVDSISKSSRSMGTRSDSGLSEISSNSNNERPEFFRRYGSSQQMSHRSLGSSVDNINERGEALDSREVEAKAAEVEALLKDVSAAGNIEFMVDLLTNSIRSHQYIARVLEICFKQIWDLCKFNEENKVHIMQAGLADDIVNSMRRHRKSVVLQERACGCLWSLSVNQFNRIVLVRAGAVRGVFRALEENINDESFLETALGCLRTISPDSEGRHAIQQLLGAQRVCRAMALHRTVASIQRDGCAFLSNVAVDMDNQEVSVVSREELDTVVRVLGDHMRNEYVASSAVFALKNYTYEEKNLRALRRCDDIFSLLEDAGKYSTKHEIRVDATEVLERLRMLCEEDDALEEIALGSMQDAMKNPSITVEESAKTIHDVLQEYEWSEKLICYSLDCLLTMGNKGASGINRISQLDILKVVVNAMRKQKKSPKVQERACELMRFLAEQGSKSRGVIRDADGCTPIISALRVHRGVDAVQIPAFNALKILALDPRCHEIIESNGGLSRLQSTIARQESRGGHSLPRGLGPKVGLVPEKVA